MSWRRVDYGGPVAAVGRPRQPGRHPVSSGKKPGDRPGGDQQFPVLAALMAIITLYPAIDLKDGACVRLVKGDMEAATVFNTDPGAQADRFAGRAPNGSTWSI